MIATALTRIFGSKNERYLKGIRPLVDRINSLEAEVVHLEDAGIAQATAGLRERIAKGQPLDELLPEAFALVREAARRVLGERHYDAQMVGGIVLHQGKIAEMKTGEGKTLCSTLPVYLNALSGRGVHVVTVNDYLARRDAEWMGKVYHFLGMTTGTIVHDMDDIARRDAYAADITYGTNNELGFDYLRDNMKFDIAHYCQRGFYYAIVDEVDSILIDEARTPLIISGPAEMSTALYSEVNRIISRLHRDEHYTVDEKGRTVSLNEEGVALGEKLLRVDNLYDPANIESLHHLNQALRAHVLFQLDVDYVVQDGQVVIVDEFTGRTMPGRRYSDGLHQALEAKEGVKVEQENQTLASITFQNYFRMYEKLAGMTGTADTEAAEFRKIYNLDVAVIPTHRPMVRIDYPDVIYKNTKAKYRAVVAEIKALHEKGQPILVGTISIEVSELLSGMLQKAGIPHEVLNAKQHAREAEIVAVAGQKGKVTIATNMAGRGTDIKLGPGVPDLGGLHILGTSRHEARRIDNQLRGRSGRQGDAGSSRFFLSLEDDLLRIFGSDRISGIMNRLGMEEDEPIEHGIVSKAIENAQRKVEGHNFDMRKHLLEYDDVMNRQREVIYRQRREVLAAEDVHAAIHEMTEDMIQDIADRFAVERDESGRWDWDGIVQAVAEIFGFRLDWPEDGRRGLDRQGLADKIRQAVSIVARRREEEMGIEALRHVEKIILLQVVDHHWKEHLLNMDHLKEGIGLRGYGQKNPLDEYKKEGFALFGAMVETIKQKAVSTIFHIQVSSEDDLARQEEERRRRQEREMQLVAAGAESAQSKGKPVRRDGDKVGRNDLCPCGSGKKFKKCCGLKKD